MKLLFNILLVLSFLLFGGCSHSVPNKKMNKITPTRMEIVRPIKSNEVVEASVTAMGLVTNKVYHKPIEIKGAQALTTKTTINTNKVIATKKLSPPDVSSTNQEPIKTFKIIVTANKLVIEEVPLNLPSTYKEVERSFLPLVLYYLCSAVLIVIVWLKFFKKKKRNPLVSPEKK